MRRLMSARSASAAVFAQLRRRQVVVVLSKMAAE
jgi:hypothetical protein